VIVGVLGAGTMGAGIAQLARRRARTRSCYDPDKAALASGIRSIGDRLAREVEKGRLAAGRPAWSRRPRSSTS
jgi:3-hydroxyacyl-CoA dehydrogenase